MTSALRFERAGTNQCYGYCHSADVSLGTLRGPATADVIWPML